VKSGWFHVLGFHSIPGCHYAARYLFCLAVSGAPPCRATPDTGGILSALPQIIEQIPLRISRHIPPGCNLGAGAVATKAIAARRIDLADRNARRWQSLFERRRHQNFPCHAATAQISSRRAAPGSIT
jgi:hypothetical protein